LCVRAARFPLTTRRILVFHRTGHYAVILSEAADFFLSRRSWLVGTRSRKISPRTLQAAFSGVGTGVRLKRPAIQNDPDEKAEAS
jgi:hypothetical protein